MLWQVRRDDGTFTCPGGHLEPGEAPRAGAARELFEEAGVDCDEAKLQELGAMQCGRHLVHCFRLDLDQPADPTAENDPDEEAERFVWADVEDGELPREIAQNLHNPDNALLQALGMQERPAGVEKVEPGEYWSGEEVAVVEADPRGVGFCVSWADLDGGLGGARGLSKSELGAVLGAWMRKADGDPPPVPTTPPAAPPAKKPRATKPKPAPEKKLVVQHNLSERGLHNAHKIGGLPAPSLAVAHKDHPLTGFGEISLVGHSGLVDPKQKVPLYDADVYSPRYPRAKSAINEREHRKLENELRPHLEATNELGYRSLDAHDFRRELEGGASGREIAQLHSGAVAALGHAYLKQIGEEPPPLGTKPKRHRSWNTYDYAGRLKEFAGQMPRHISYHSPQHAEITRRVNDAIDEHYGAGSPDAEEHKKLVGVLDENGVPQQFMDFNKTDSILEQARNHGQTEPDFRGLHYALHDRLAEDPGFHDFIDPLKGDEYIEVGESRRKQPHTLENVLKQLTRKVRGGEGGGSFFGPGYVRSLGANKFRSLDSVRGSAHRLVSHDQMEQAKNEWNDKLSEVAGDLKHHHPASDRFGFLDTVNSAMADYMKSKNAVAALRENGFDVRSMPPESVQRFRQLAQDLVSMPTEYFEAKPQRAVGLNEFRGAAVPHTASQRTREILAQHGLRTEDYRSGDEEDRKRAIQKLAQEQDLMLSEDALQKARRGKNPGWNTNDQLSEAARQEWFSSGVGPEDDLEFRMVPIENVEAVDFDDPKWAEPAPWNKKQSLDPKGGPKHVKKLASLMERGTELPPAAGYAYRSGKIGIIDGAHRLAAAKRLRQTHIPMWVHTAAREKVQKSEASGRHILVCIPKSRQKQVEQEEADVAKMVAAGQKPPTYFWTVHRLPKELPGRVYFCWDGAVRAYHDCVGSVTEPDHRLLLDHEIHEVEPVPHQSFRGWRYWEHEGLAKALSDVPDAPVVGDGVFDYNHLLAPELRAGGYSLRAVESGDGRFGVDVQHSGETVGYVAGGVSGGEAAIEMATVHEPHQKQGLGSALYEAFAAHARNRLGATKLVGDSHTLDAQKRHEWLSRKHGLDYTRQGRGYSYDLGKSEQTDPILRLLQHPDPAERTMALKHRGVRRHHLVEALLSGDPVLESAALAHPGLDEEVLRGIVTSADRWDLKRKLLARKDLPQWSMVELARAAVLA